MKVVYMKDNNKNDLIKGKIYDVSISKEINEKFDGEFYILNDTNSIKTILLSDDFITIKEHRRNKIKKFLNDN